MPEWLEIRELSRSEEAAGQRLSLESLRLSGSSTDKPTTSAPGEDHVDALTITSAEFKIRATHVFKAVDKNKDKILDEYEIKAAIERDASITGKNAQALVAVAVLSRTLDHRGSGGSSSRRYAISEEKLTQFWFDLNRGKARDDELKTALRAQMYINRTAQAQNYSSQLFANKDNPHIGIKAEDVNQGALGTCAFLAPLSSLAANRPRQIPEMVTDNGNGTYSVKFPLLDEKITVRQPTEAERGLYAQGSESGIWPTVMEKAFRTAVYKHTGKPASDAAFGNVSVWNAGFQYLTGYVPEATTISHINPYMSEDVLHEMLAGASRRGAVMEADRYDIPRLGPRDENENLPESHAYGVIGYDAANRRVTIRNPWGTVEPEKQDGTPLDGKDDGVFEMTLRQFRRNFEMLLVE